MRDGLLIFLFGEKQKTPLVKEKDKRTPCFKLMRRIQQLGSFYFYFSFPLQLLELNYLIWYI